MSEDLKHEKHMVKFYKDHYDEFGVDAPTRLLKKSTCCQICGSSKETDTCIRTVHTR